MAPWIAIAVAALAVGGVLGYVLRGGSGLQLDTEGPPQGTHVHPRNVHDMVVQVRAVHHPDAMRDARLTLNGRNALPQASIQGGVLTWRPRALAEGKYRLKLSVTQPGVPWPARRTWSFVVDKTPPKMRVTRPAPVHALSPVRISGRLLEPATLTADGQPVRVVDGRFTLAYPAPPTGVVMLRAVDGAGNVSIVPVAVPVVPRHPPSPVRAVHMTAISWRIPHLRNAVLAMADRGEINAVELDLKDESGVVGYDSHLPMARRIGAVEPSYDLADALRTLHRRGLWVIGRIVVFRDPILATYAWKEGRRKEVVQTPDGQLYGAYGGFTNLANPTVRRYNIDIAREAAAAGIDDILYDYVRRPDGPISTMRFPGLKGRPEDAVVGFTAQTRKALLPYKVFFGASLFGVSASRPEEVAQDARRIARTVDYVAPLVYPSHWGGGEYGVPDPQREPYLIVRRSLAAFQQRVKGTGARLVPWLQDFSLAVHYGPAEVRAQIRAARSLGIDEFIMWDPRVNYTTGAYGRG